MSGSTGHPVWRTRSLDPDISFAIDTRVDHADAALEKYDAEHRDDKKVLGQTRFAVAIGADGKPIEYDGHTRHRFQMSAIQETRARLETEAEEGEYEDDLEGYGSRAAHSGGFDPAEYGDGLTTPA